MEELFVFGSMWFWALMAIELIVLFAFVEYEQNVLCTLSLVTVGLLVYFFGDGPTWVKWLFANPIHFGVGTFLYFFTGAMCCLLLWYLFVREIDEHKEKRKAEFFESLPNYLKGVKSAQEIDDINASIEQHKMVGSVKLMWDRIATQTYRDKWNHAYNLEKPKRSKNKARLMGWICFWPPVVMWRLIHDPVRWLGNMTYELITSCLDKITDSAWTD